MAEIGRIALVVGFVVTAYLTVASALGIAWRQPDLLASARRAVYAAGALITLAWGTLLYAFLTHDFSILYVAKYNSRATEWAFSLSGSYAGQEGSLLMWAWGIIVVLVIATIQFRGKMKTLMPWVIAVTGFVASFFLSLLVFISDPFVRTQVIPPDGQGLNPMLQNIGMLYHPPTLYIGYVAFTIPFAFALAALITGQLGEEWIKAIRGWTLVAWAFLGIGNLLGAQWAYVELGWGGYWAWDPVENSSFMPWLTGTAFLHSIMMQRRRGMLKIWNLSLVIATFTLTIFGTYITRSDILSSVHTFGATGLGPMFVGMILLTITVSAALIWDRLPLLKGDNELDSLVSRESSFLLNNLLLVGATFAVFWGTMFPVISDAVRGTRVTVNASFFDQVVGPILLAIILLMGICPLIGWRAASLNSLLKSFRLPAVLGVVAAAITVAIGIRELYAIVAMAVCGFVIGTVVLEFVRGMRAEGRITNRAPALTLPPLVWKNKSRYGGLTVHLGIVIMAIGIVGSYGFATEKDVVLDPGQEATIGSYRLVYQGLGSSRERTKEVVAASITVYSGDRLIGNLSPSKEFHQGWESPYTEPAIYSTITEDLYLILNSWDAQQKAGLRLVVNPMVTWIWVGGWVVVLGALVAFWPDARERRREEVRRALERSPEELRTAGA
jgi:cytochrome c-type biogenesis protein CcmF